MCPQQILAVRRKLHLDHIMVIIADMCQIPQAPHLNGLSFPKTGNVIRK
jgi:hypothetical protein